MAKVTVAVECSKEIYELGKGVAEMVKELKAAVADGWQMGSDLPVAVSAVLGKLVPALQGVEKIKDELAEDKFAAVNAVTVAGSAIVGALLS